MDNFCRICNVNCDTKKNFNNHVQSAKHSRKIRQSIDRNRSLFVAGFPKGFEEKCLHDHFCQYGFVTQCIIDRKKGTFGFVEFADQGQRSNAMRSPHRINQRDLFVQACEQRFDDTKKSENNHDSIVASLESCKSVRQIVERFHCMYSLDEAELARRITLRNKIAEAARLYYPECVIDVFGSTLNFLGMRGCDVDILFQPTPNYFSILNSNYDLAIENSNMPFLRDLKNGRIHPDDILPEHNLRLLQKILRENCRGLSNILYIPARCPIVKLNHAHLGLQCDISCSNRLVLFNTTLIRTYSNLDARFSPLTMLLRYMAKYKDLVGVGNLSSYTFTMLVVFFLQNTKPPVLPSVRYLQTLTDCYECENQWNCSLCTDIDMIPKSENKDPVEVLLAQFFKFYAAYDFSLVICPNSAEATERENFEYSEQDNDKNFQVSPMCVQDPLQLNRNLTSFIKAKTLISLKQWVTAGINIFSRNSIEPSSSVRNVLSLLKKGYPTRQAKSRNLVFEILDPCVVLQQSEVFALSFTSDVQKRVMKNPGEIFGKIFHTLKFFLEYSLLFEVDIVDQIDIAGPYTDLLPVATSEELNQSATDSDSSVSFEDFACSWKFTEFGEQTWKSFDSEKPRLVLSVQCMAFYNTWFARNKNTVSVEHPKGTGNNIVNIIERERKISVDLSKKKHNELSLPYVFTIDILVYKKKSNEIDLVFIGIPDESFSPEFSSFVCFFKPKILSILESMLH